MTVQEIVNQENAVLRSELGTNPLWAWKHSSTLRLRIQKIVESATAVGGIQPQYHYRANPMTGIIELSPEYVDMPMLPMVPNSWLLCRFVPSDQESVFRQNFGVRVEYPVGGIWQPLQHTALKPGIIPNRTDTWNMIQGARANRVAVRDYFDNAEEIQNKREKADATRFGEMVRDKFSAGMEVPGSKSSTSFFNAPSSEPVIFAKDNA
jgi:hypothetical protein